MAGRRILIAPPTSVARNSPYNPTSLEGWERRERGQLLPPEEEHSLDNRDEIQASCEGCVTLRPVCLTTRIASPDPHKVLLTAPNSILIIQERSLSRMSYRDCRSRLCCNLL